ncbi:MAG: hypothetical protein V1770_05095 [bacterium]
MDYRPPLTPISDKDLERGYWFITHKIFLKRLGYSLLVLFNVLSISFSAYKIINFYTIEASEYDRMIADLTQTNYAILNSNRTLPLEIGNVRILSSGKNFEPKEYDLIAEIYNPNEKFRVEFDYQFICDNKNWKIYHAFILPRQKKIIADYGLTLTGRKDAQIKIIKQEFKRISPHEIKNPISFIEERLLFETTNVELIEVGKNIYKISFDLANKSSYNFWEVGLTTVLYKGSEIFGIDNITLEKFRSGTEREVEVTWHEYVPPTIKILAMPEIDVFDEENYMEFEGEQKGLGF